MTDQKEMAVEWLASVGIVALLITLAVMFVTSEIRDGSQRATCKRIAAALAASGTPQATINIARAAGECQEK